jgi:hypothetical protein
MLHPQVCWMVSMTSLILGFVMKCKPKAYSSLRDVTFVQILNTQNKYLFFGMLWNNGIWKNIYIYLHKCKDMLGIIS